MDSLAASVTTGSVIKEYKRRHIFRIASIMAMFQAGMTMIGYFAGIGFSNYICRFDHWIAFFLLLPIARTLSDTFAGIAPSSVPMFLAMQLAGTAIAFGLVAFLYPRQEPT